MSSALEAPISNSVSEVVDTEALLAPIAGENPSGEYLKYSGVYDQIMEARRSEDTLEQGDWKRETKVADWGAVETLSTDALANRSKDLQICAWLVEALIKNYGFEGLRDGLRVMRGLHERFWETVYPEIDRGDEETPTSLADGDVTARANALSLMDRQAATALRDLPLTQARTGLDYSFNQYEDSKQFNIPEKLDEASSDDAQRATALRERAREEGKITSEDWLKAKSATPRAFYEATFAVINECWTEFTALDGVMDETFKRETPGLGALKKVLDDIRTAVERIVKEKRVLEPDPVSDAGAAASTDGGAGAEANGTGGTSGAGASVGSGVVRSRQEALRKLSEVADYFRQTEPHSPVSYLVQRAIRWGEMPLETWLEDVVKNDGVLEQLRETLGLKSGSATDDASADES